MSNPKFIVFKLKDLRIPALILLIVVALLVMLMVKNKTATTFAPSSGYDDGKYIASIELTDANMDLVVEIKDSNIVSISLSGLEEMSSVLYNDLVSSIEYINTYVTATQSLELPQNGSTSTATLLLMDAVKVALSEDANASITTTYEKVNLTPTSDTPLVDEVVPETSTEALTETSTDDIFVDEFSEEDFIVSDSQTIIE